MNKVTEKFLEYIKFDTTAVNEKSTFPSSDGQIELAKHIERELKSMKLSNVNISDCGILQAELPSNISKKVPTIGFITHLDTSPDFPGANVKAQIFKNYDGNDLILNEELNIVLSPKYYPELRDYIGDDIITTDGTTLLGADDKAGIAEIMTSIEYLVNHPEIPHGTIKLAFMPDEELDNSCVNIFNVEEFGADIAYTIDGDGIGELNYENFNASCVSVKIKGISIHAGEAKNKLVNSLVIANEFFNMLPGNERPEHTCGYEGFYYLTDMSGDCEETNMTINIRSFDNIDFNRKKEYVKTITNYLNLKYGFEVVFIQLRDIYYNMGEVINYKSDLVQIPIKAMIESGVKPKVVPIRGGTDGAVLTFKGLLTPNIFIGGHNYHGKFEYIPIQSMEKAVQVILKTIELYTNL